MPRRKVARFSPIDARLQEMGQNRKWLAQQVGVSEGHIGRLCRGDSWLNTSNPRNVLCRKIKTVLGVNNDYLVFGRK